MKRIVVVAALVLTLAAVPARPQFAPRNRKTEWSTWSLSATIYNAGEWVFTYPVKLDLDG
jgi:hypothetical protein